MRVVYIVDIINKKDINNKVNHNANNKLTIRLLENNEDRYNL